MQAITIYFLDSRQTARKLHITGAKGNRDVQLFGGRQLNTAVKADWMSEIRLDPSISSGNPTSDAETIQRVIQQTEDASSLHGVMVTISLNRWAVTLKQLFS